MKLTKPLCRQVKIYNQWEYAKGRPYLYYSAAEYGRASKGAAWMVTQAGKKFSDFWRDYGSRSFMVFGCSKQAAFEMAAEWMRNELGVTDLVKTPFGSWMNREFVEARNAEIIAALKAQEEQE